MSNTVKITLASIIGVIVLFGFVAFGSYNSLVSSENNVDAKWSQVENVMQRRYDLVPNLQAAVKGSMKHETKVFGQIADARKQYANASSSTDKLKANDQMQAASSTLINVIHENYPELASNENVKSLMTQLEGSENRISTERREYILAVQSYNLKVQRFPGNIFANIFGFNKKAEYKANDAAQTAPSINLDEN